MLEDLCAQAPCLCFNQLSSCLSGAGSLCGDTSGCNPLTLCGNAWEAALGFCPCLAECRLSDLCSPQCINSCQDAVGSSLGQVLGCKNCGDCAACCGPAPCEDCVALVSHYACCICEGCNLGQCLGGLCGGGDLSPLACLACCDLGLILEGAGSLVGQLCECCCLIVGSVADVGE